jgi:hypothetical protein
LDIVYSRENLSCGAIFEKILIEMHSVISEGRDMFICDEINSKEKIQSYLDEVFTPTLSNEIISHLKLREIDKKLAFSPGDWGSMLDWSSIKVIDTKYDRDKVIYRYKVGLFDTSAKPETIEISFRYINKLGWRVDTDPQYYL